jgi:hypothetical protein
VPADEFEKMMAAAPPEVVAANTDDNTSDTIMIRALRKA